MGLFRKFAARRIAKRLQDAGLPDGSLGEVQAQLVELGPDAIRSVLQSLRSVDGRQASIEVLQRLVSDHTLSIFLEALGSTDPSIQAGVTTVLSNAGGYDPARLLELFSNPRVSRARLETILSAQGQNIPPRTLLSALPDLNRDARSMVFRLLDQNADGSIVGDAVPLAAHTDWWLRLHMAKLLARFPGPESIRTVVGMLGDENRAVRVESVQCLGRLKAVEAIPGLCECLRDPDLKVQTAAIDSLIQIHDPAAVPHLVEVLKDESEQARRGAVEVLNEVITVDAIKDLVHALRDADWWVRVRAADALGTLGGDKVVEAVIGLLKDPDEFVRRYAVEILNSVPSTGAVDPLIEALDDPDWWVHERAIDALAQAGDARAVEPLLRLMGRESRAIPLCLRALGKLRDEQAVDPVCRMVSSENAEVRREALLALAAFAEGSLTDGARARVRETLEAAGVPLERKGLRPMEVRGTRAQTPRTLSWGNAPPSSSSDAPSPSGIANAPRSTPVSTQVPAPPLNFQDLAPGTRLIERFAVIRRIGGGGFGAVYLVEDVVVREELVLKILNPQLSIDQNMIRRFVQELKFTRRITHPNVIRIYDLIDLGVAHAISMEHFLARDLGTILRECTSLPVATALRIAMQVCDGLQAAHDRLHQDRGLRPCLGGRGGGIPAHQEWDPGRDAGIHLARADHGGASRLPHRSLLARRRRVRDADWKAALRERHRRQHPVPAPRVRSALDAGSRSVAARIGEPRGDECHGAGAFRAAELGGGVPRAVARRRLAGSPDPWPASTRSSRSEGSRAAPTSTSASASRRWCGSTASSRPSNIAR